MRVVRPVLGAPSWVSLIAGDLDVAQRFYGELLGWDFEHGPERLGPYVSVLADGVPVAGISGVAISAGTGVGWTPFFGVKDAHEAARRGVDRGGTIGVGPVSIDAGRIVIARDPDGASFGLWQGRAAGVGDPPRQTGVPDWIELRTADAFKAALFYGEVLDWDAAERCEVFYEHERVVLRVDGRSVAALRGLDRPASEDAPVETPRWQISFAAPDVDRAAARAVELGGRVVRRPMDTPYGRTTELADVEGGLFSLITPKARPSATAGE
ncbi:VOC family protein [Streptacidiphilus sp. NEAU-YB345]|uniref:VOC family protein n=2 Tax=Streptacidiphilus fuscans TaxID=2789292 RepID=A0A931B229_9ACTN|nr:VOC family protein [Streptacidiphilus fuscans]